MLRVLVAAVVGASLLLTGCSAGHGSSGSTDTYASVDSTKEAAIIAAIEKSIPKLGLKSVIVNVRQNDGTIIRKAFGESQTGVPATTDMHFRNGAVAISYLANLLLQFVDEGHAQLSDRVSRWLPEVPHAEKVTLQQLAQMTSGYQDYVQDPTFIEAFLSDPFRFTTTEEQLAAAAKPLSYPPGTNWSYSHTNYVILGLALEKIGGKPLNELLQEKVLDPLNLNGTTADDNAPIPEPALHAFSSERRESLKIPAGVDFLEESTYWNPSWTLAHGSIQTTNIDDLATTAEAIGTGKLLSDESFKLMTSTSLRGFGKAQKSCPTCAPQTEAYSYGLGVVTSGNWLFQNPMFGGYAAVMSYLPDEKISVSVATTLTSNGFDAAGVAPNTATELFREIAAIVAPNNQPPSRK